MMADRAPVAVVTGAGSGLGREVALGLLRNGYRVALAGRRENALLETAAEETGAGDRTMVAPTDVCDPAAVEALFARVVDDFQRVDLLFNNAGAFGEAAPIEDVRFEAWETIVATNLTGAFLCAQAAFRAMKAQRPSGGRIINNGSISAHVPRPHSVAYTASKHGVTGLTKSLSLEGRTHRIACGQIDIGNAASALTEDLVAGALQPNGTIISEPTMSPQHVADAVLYMAGLPLDANVQFITVMATTMPYIGRG